ncbi:MAG: dihydrodipicolinate reductase [Pseudomonadota bacterium]
MNQIPIMLNGLPGNVATIIARHFAGSDRFHLMPYSLTGPEITAAHTEVAGRKVSLIRPSERDARLPEIAAAAGQSLIVVDFTHPSAVNDNAAFYCRNGLSFVMGTTGGDRQALVKTVTASPVAAVIAPNMAKPIVGLQAMFEYAAEQFPGLFSGYRMTVIESHQQGKADTSGTAKAVVHSFNRLGVDFPLDAIHKERDPQIQRRDWGIPEAYLGGHGWHTYSLTSADDTVTLAFTHNINGREVYAHGTLDAAAFLAARVAEGAAGRVYSMIDVLRGR